MNLIKRIFFAWRALWRSRLLLWVFVLMAMFYIWAAMDLFWIGTEAWQSAAMSVLFMLPLFVYLAAIVLVYVYADATSSPIPSPTDDDGDPEA